MDCPATYPDRQLPQTARAVHALHKNVGRWPAIAS
jgi:hypothetical protein